MSLLQIGNMYLNNCIYFIQQQEIIQKYKHYKSQPSEQTFADTYMLKSFLKCSYCEREDETKKEKCPAFRKTCTNWLKKDNVQVVCKFRKKKRWKSWWKRNQSRSLLNKKNRNKEQFTTPPIWWVGHERL